MAQIVDPEADAQNHEAEKSRYNTAYQNSRATAISYFMSNPEAVGEVFAEYVGEQVRVDGASFSELLMSAMAAYTPLRDRVQLLLESQIDAQAHEWAKEATR